MHYTMQYRKQVDINPFNSIASILMLVLVFVGLYFIAKGIFNLLAIAAPFLLIGALLLNYRVVINYGKWLLKMLQTNPLVGIGGVLLTVFGFPVIAGFLFGKAYLYRKVNSLQQAAEQAREGEFVEYEEIPDEPLDLPRIEPLERKRSSSNEYDELFDEP